MALSVKSPPACDCELQVGGVGRHGLQVPVVPAAPAVPDQEVGGAVGVGHLQV